MLIVVQESDDAALLSGAWIVFGVERTVVLMIAIALGGKSGDGALYRSRQVFCPVPLSGFDCLNKIYRRGVHSKLLFWDSILTYNARVCAGDHEVCLQISARAQGAGVLAHTCTPYRIYLPCA